MTLLKNGADIHSVDRLGRTLLHLAALYNMPALGEKLIALHVGIMARDYCSMLPLHLALERDHVAVFQVLVIFSLG